MRVTQTAKDPQTMFTAARNSIRYEIWDLSRLLLRAVVRLVTPTEIKTLVDMRTRSTTDLPPKAAFFSNVPN
jgi:hypothetical protein